MSDPPANKRPRLMGHSSPTVLAELPEAVLQHCFSFLGSGHYRYVAGTSRLFRNIYSIKHENKTLWKNAAASASCADLCLEDAIEQKADVSAALSLIAIEMAKAGRIDMLGWAHVRGCKWEHSIFTEAAKFGHVCVLEWAEAKHVDWYSGTLVRTAASYGHINVLEWIVNCGRQVPMDASNYAAGSGQVAVICWMKERNLVPHNGTMFWYMAALCGRLDVLDCLLHSGYDIHPQMVFGGIVGNRINSLEWARNHGFSWSRVYCECAASHGNLHILQWLRENGCPWDGHVIRAARRGGHQDIVDWAIENGCPESAALV